MAEYLSERPGPSNGTARIAPLSPLQIPPPSPPPSPSPPQPKKQKLQKTNTSNKRNASEEKKNKRGRPAPAFDYTQCPICTQKFGRESNVWKPHLETHGIHCDHMEKEHI